jgi:hypothetical protein
MIKKTDRQEILRAKNEILRRFRIEKNLGFGQDPHKIEQKVSILRTL